jgi:hypothetical protein
VLDLEFVDQNFLDGEILPSRGAGRQLQLLRGNDGIGHQEIIFRLDGGGRLAALGKGDGQGFAQALDALLGDRRKRSSRLVVDDLDDAQQLAVLRVDDRRHQHLLGPVAGALVHLLQEAQGRIDRLEFGVVIDVADVHRLLGQRDMAGDALVGDRQAQVLERIQAGLDLRNDRRLVLADE